MFKSNYPLFDSGRILKSAMLEDLRDYPREFVNIKYGSYSNGIIAGCKIDVIDNFIVIKRGILKYKENIYILSKDYPIKYENNNVLTSLKIKFLPANNAGEYVKNETEIYLSEKIENDDYEMELCRFKLRTGAKLRREYVGFKDFSTEFDTVNIINTPFAAYGNPSLSPDILRSFGLEMLRCGLSESFDISFAMLCVQSRETIEKDIIISYIVSKLNEEYKDYSNEEIFNYLNRILENMKYGQDSHGSHSKGRFKRILID